jgi:hypothetical protein
MGVTVEAAAPARLGDDDPWADLPISERGFLRSRRVTAEVADELRRGVHAEPAEWEPAR